MNGATPVSAVSDAVPLSEAHVAGVIEMDAVTAAGSVIGMDDVSAQPFASETITEIVPAGSPLTFCVVAPFDQL
jgi:hypothetical protein